MKKLMIPAAAALACTLAQAGAGVMVGVSYNFGGTAGITFKVLSTDRVDRAAAVVGVTYFPSQTQNPWGLDAGLGYNAKRATVSLSYDFLNQAPQLSLGLNNAKDKPTTQAAAPVPAPAPAPAPTPAPAPAPVVTPPAPAPVPAPSPGSGQSTQAGPAFDVFV